MRIIYKRILSFIIILLVATITIGIIYLFYDKNSLNKSVVVVENELSINYLNGNRIKDNGQYKFSITNNSVNDIYYTVFADKIKKFGTVNYEVTTKENNLNIKNKLDKENPVIVDGEIIKSGETINFILLIKDNEDTSFTLNVKKETEIEEYFFNTILKNNKVKENAVTKIGEEIAITNEGLIEDVDDAGITYYFRGKVDNNYVSFADNLWRIVRINGDGTVRLVLNSATGELTSYHSDFNDIADYTKTDIYNNLNTWYTNNIKKYSDYVATSKFCYENNKEEGKEFYNAHTRLVTNIIPTFNCLGEKITGDVGLLTADEVIFAGANLENDNTSFYLYNKEINNLWWTSSLARKTSTYFYPFIVNNNGKMTFNSEGNIYKSLRPVINITKKVTVKGTGTETDPYIIS